MAWFRREKLENLSNRLDEVSGKAYSAGYACAHLKEEVAILKALLWDRQFEVVSQHKRQRKEELRKEGYSLRGIVGESEVWVKQ